MGRNLYESDAKAHEMFEKANEILGFRITDIMFGEDAEALKATNVTQPAVFLHSVISCICSGMPAPEMAAGHSLGEFSALVAAGALSFEDGLRLVAVRAGAMQKACEMAPGTMAAVLKTEDAIIEDACRECKGIVVPANYNSDGQVVVSGEIEAIAEVTGILKAKGVKRIMPLTVGGAFHSPLMEPARKELAEAIGKVDFKKPVCPIYQNVDAKPHSEPSEIKANLLMQLTSPVRWTLSVKNMVADGASVFTEFGPGKVLSNLVSRIAPDVQASPFETPEE